MIKIIDGKKIAEEIKRELEKDILALAKKGVIPSLAVILVGEDNASLVYVKNKERVAKEIGINYRIIKLGDKISQEELEKVIEKLNQDKNIHGFLVQLPLPAHLDSQNILSKIDPAKDVDCFHPENVGRIFAGNPRFLPCTPAGIIELLKRNKIEIVGKKVVIIGRSNIVGKPLALMLLAENATVTICHSKTKDLKAETLQADILVSAVGKAGLIIADMVKKGATVIDVGMNRDNKNKLTGDVDFEEVSKIAGAITPVPGGVGPMTVVMLMRNVMIAVNN
ncbi:MAG TPA: bifunctional methylenetetrahydrofolate dehydrogenase/methenyltetrahydrofolate cyclohydrolase FolD [Candidatus Moranbacteria bacterium]|nr:bifunctional methylenetetrahydrofolate dehydrogenase/methenyltetrahydrofolate cyclohydrolase FolD [Candidatus Moranbacteria bacterium]HAT74770.1 bifunctional methylenetetrahydrofolate dehydrogenase/methenyltetrahydrofolate cyclohydrolase FolD [Candidatus Moranbacteria bacterium]